MADRGRDVAARARSFGAVADAYHRYRPGYPDAALDWALAPMDATAPVLLDLGAGTGKLTASLLPRAAEVIAVEPDPEMLAVLRSTLPTVTALPGSAEAIPLPDASVDAVLIGQALHWFDLEPATAQIVRVLRPGGVVAALWNGEDPDVEWARRYYEIAGWSGRAGQARARPRLAANPALGPPASASFANPVPATVEGMLDTLSTYSWVRTLDEPRRQATMSAARDYLAGRPETSSGPFELPLRTEVIRAARR